MDWQRLTLRIQNHPLIVSLGLVFSVVAPACSVFANLLPITWAVVLSGALVALIVIVLFRREGAEVQTVANDVRPQRSREQSDREATLRREVHRRCYGLLGDSARVDYFKRCANREEATDHSYREIIDSFKEDPAWGPWAGAIDEWVTIGFHVLSKHHPRWHNPLTINQLYQAGCKMLLADEFGIGGGEEFARIVTSKAAQMRRSGI